MPIRRHLLEEFASLGIQFETGILVVKKRGQCLSEGRVPVVRFTLSFVKCENRLYLPRLIQIVCDQQLEEDPEGDTTRIRVIRYTQAPQLLKEPLNPRIS